MQVRVGVYIGSERGCVLNGCEKGDHFIHVGKLFLRVTYTLLANCL